MKSNTNNQIVVRMAPSPTGNLHIGTARTTLMNYLFAKKNDGKFIMRIEDTDKERSTKEFENNIVQGLEWLGLTYDNFFRQSEREEVYKKHLKKLIEDGIAYISKEEVIEEGQRAEVIRFKNPNKTIIFDDLILGQISFDTSELKDFVIARSVDEPLYHLAVVIDDFEMGVTHVIRGADHISNTPRQILIQEAIGASRPIYAHLPLILAPDRSKMSKRFGAVSIDEYKERGYLPVAILNYLALLGWNPGTEQEIFTLEELTKIFEIEKVQKGGAIFDEEKLKWINKEHMKKLSETEIQKEILNQIQLATNSKHWDDIENKVSKSWKIIFERISRWKDVLDLVSAGEFDYIFTKPEYEQSLLFWKGVKDITNASRHINVVMELLENLDDKNWNHEKIKEAIWDYATKEGRGDVLWPSRVALSGKEKSPDPFTLLEILGKGESLERLKVAVNKLV
jgi:glutamyl-tRNA synthetase